MKKLVSVCLGIMLFLSSVAISNADEKINISRVSGWDRYETTVNANKKYMNSANGNLAVIASGNDFRTAFCGSYLSSALKVPYFVNPKHGVRSDILNELKRLNVNRVYIMGDYSVLDKSIDNTLKNNKIKSERIKDIVPGEQGVIIPTLRVTSQVINFTFDTGEYHKMLINMNKFPDMLSVAPFASEMSRRFGFDLIDYGDWNRPIDDYEYVVGGMNTIPEYISIVPLGKRFDGANRYETAVKIAETFKTFEGTEFGNVNQSGEYIYDRIPYKNTVVLVNGEDYPDALSSSLVATQNNGVVLLTQPNRLNEDTANYIKNKDIKNVIIVGGEKSVSKNVENELKKLKLNEETIKDNNSSYEVNSSKFDRNGIPMDILGELDLSNVEYSVDFDKDYDLDGFR